MNKYEVYLGDLTCEKIKYSDETIKYGVKTNVIFLNNYELKEIQESMMKTLYWYLIDKSDLEHLEQELQRKDNEIKQLQEDIVNHIKIVGEYKEQKIIKNNNWNELKKWVKQQMNTTGIDISLEYKGVLDKIKELESGK